MTARALMIGSAFGVALTAAAGCHTLLGIEDTVVGDPAGRVGLDRILVAQVQAPQIPTLEGSGPAIGGLVVAEFPIGDLATPVYDGRDDLGYGCVVTVHDADATTPRSRNEGDISLTGTLAPVPPCRPAAELGGRYLCAERRKSLPDPLTVRDDSDSRATLTVAGADPPFTEADVGRFFLAAGRPPLPITAVTDDETAVLFDPFAENGEIPGAEHLVAAGLGPTPTSQAFLGDGEAIGVAKQNGSQLPGFAVEVAAAGAGYRLDDASVRPEALPISPAAATFSCSGLNGDCGAGSHVAVWARTTDVRDAALLLSAAPAPAQVAEAELTCLFDAGAGADVEVPREAMAALYSTSPRRIVSAVVRGNLELVEHPDGNEEATAVVVGFGHYGWTTLSADEDECNAVYQDCSPELRCTAVSAGDGSNATNHCLADGSVGLGQACTDLDRDVAGSTDDCTAGTTCTFGLCRAACDADDWACGQGQTCVSFSGRDFDACLRDCDPLDQSTCSNQAEGCYFAPQSPTSGVCAVPSMMAGIPVGEACETAFLNTCVPGAVCISTATTGLSCRPVCDPAPCINAAGDNFTGCGCSPSCGPEEVCSPFGGAASFGVCIRADEIDANGQPCSCTANPICPPPPP